MTEFSDITTHSADAVARLQTKDKDKAKQKSFYEAFVDQIQELETAVNDWVDNWDIDNAVGEQLDRLGDLVVQPRNGQSDSVYRVFIKVKALINFSEGTGPQIKQAWKTLSGADSVDYQNFELGGVGLMSDGSDPVGDPDTLYNLMEKAVPCGVSVDHLGFYQSSGSFGFDGDPDAAGFSDAGSGGGEFAKLILRS